MSKYILELKDDVQVVQKVGVTENGNAFVMNFYKDQLEELNSDYINEHFGDLQNTAYQKGFEDGKKEAESSEAIEQAKADAFNKGMLFKEEKIHDAFLRGVEKGKAVNDKGCEGCKYSGTPQGDSPCYNCSNYYKNNWTAKDDKIKVGDEVMHKSDSVVLKAVCIQIDTDRRHMNLMGHTGAVGYYPVEDFKKTGRRFDIQKILEAMKA